jgi:hypothetical protein
VPTAAASTPQTTPGNNFMSFNFRQKVFGQKVFGLKAFGQ